MKDQNRFRIAGVQMSPCIVAKVRYALGISDLYEGNDKKCTQEYWDSIVDYFGMQNKLPAIRVSEAKRRTDLFR